MILFAKISTKTHARHGRRGQPQNPLEPGIFNLVALVFLYSDNFVADSFQICFSQCFDAHGFLHAHGVEKAFWESGERHVGGGFVRRGLAPTAG